MPEFSTDNQPDRRGDPKEAGNAHKKRRVMTDALMLALKREVENSDGAKTKRLVMIAEKLAERAADGDIQAIKEIFDRTEGKAAQAIHITEGDTMSHEEWIKSLR